MPARNRKAASRLVIGDIVKRVLKGFKRWREGGKGIGLDWQANWFEIINV